MFRNSVRHLRRTQLIHPVQNSWFESACFRPSPEVSAPRPRFGLITRLTARGSSCVISGNSSNHDDPAVNRHVIGYHGVGEVSSHLQAQGPMGQSACLKSPQNPSKFQKYFPFSKKKNAKTSGSIVQKFKNVFFFQKKKKCKNIWLHSSEFQICFLFPKKKKCKNICQHC